MARRKNRLAAVTKKVRDLAHSAPYIWLWDHARIVEDSLARTNAIWAALADTMAADGVLTSNDKPPGRRHVRETWARVSVDLAADREAKKVASERAGHRSRRTKGWVPPSSAPAQSAPVQTTSRRDTTPHPAAPTPPASASPAPPRATASHLHGPAGTKLLSDVTPEEAEYLVDLGHLPEKARLTLLANFRTMAHMDRFNKPFRK